MIILLLIFLVVCFTCVSDIRLRRISNTLCVTLFLLSISLSFHNNQTIEGGISTAIVLTCSLLLFYFKVIAAGDGKLAAALAAALLPGQLPDAVFLTLLAGGVLAAFYLIKDRLILKKKPGEDRGLPYGVAISFGFYLTIIANSI